MSKFSFEESFPNQTPASLLKMAKPIAATVAGLETWGKEHSAYVIFSVCANEQVLFAGMRGKKGTLDTYIYRWLSNFAKGYANRASQRTGQAVQTVPDPMVNKIIATATGLSAGDVKTIIEHHRQGMAAENILGALLEEYIAESVAPHGWHCCWGNALRAVDFCSMRGQLLQIKNRDNSENSSSGSVRVDTKIEKWFRIFSKTGETNWLVLQSVTGCSSLSENSFTAFIQRTMAANRRLLAL